MQKFRRVHILSLIFIVALSACKQNVNLSPQVSYTEIDFSVETINCGDVLGFVNKGDSVFLYLIARDCITFKSVDNSIGEICYEFPDFYTSSASSGKIADVLPINNEELIISCIDDSLNVCVTSYHCIENTIDTICLIDKSEEVIFPGTLGGNIDNFYHKASNIIFITAIDCSVSDTECQKLDVRLVYHINLTTGEHSFIDLKYPENYLDRILVSMTSDCLFSEYKDDLLVVFPMDEAVYKYHPAGNSLNLFEFEAFEHNPFLSMTIVKTLEKQMELNSQTFMYSQLFYDDSVNYFYRFFRDKADNQNPKDKPLYLALYDEDRTFVNKFSLDSLGIVNTLYCSYMTKNGLLYIDDLDKEAGKIKLAYLRVR